MNELKVKFIQSLNIAIQKLLLYGFSHPEFDNEIKKNYILLNKFFTTASEAVILINAEGIYFNNELLKINKLIIKFFNKFVTERNITGFLLRKGLSQDEYKLFWKVMIEAKGKTADDIKHDLDVSGVKYANFYILTPQFGYQPAGSVANDNKSNATDILVAQAGVQNIANGSGVGVVGGITVGSGGNGDVITHNSYAGTKNKINEKNDIGNIVAKISDEDIEKIMKDEIDSKYLEKKYNLLAWDRLNSLDKIMRLEAYSALPKDMLDIDIVAIYGDVAYEKREIALKRIIYFFLYNIGDIRYYIKKLIFEKLYLFLEFLRKEDFEKISYYLNPIWKFIRKKIDMFDEVLVEKLAKILKFTVSKFLEFELYEELEENCLFLTADDIICSKISKIEIYDMLKMILANLREGDIDKKKSLENVILNMKEYSVNVLLQELMEEKDRNMRREIIHLLVRTGDTAIPYLKRMLIDKRWFVVRNGIKILGEIGKGFDLKILRKFFDYPDERVRSEMIVAFYKIGNEEAAELLSEYIMYEGKKELVLRAIKGISTIANDQIMKKLYDYFLSIFKNKNYFDIASALIDEFVRYVQKSEQFKTIAFEFCSIKQGGLFSSDIVLKLQIYFLRSLRRSDNKVFNEIFNKLKKSKLKQHKKLILKYENSV